jgi:hypothetical protein
MNLAVFMATKNLYSIIHYARIAEGAKTASVKLSPLYEGVSKIFRTGAAIYTAVVVA